MKEHEYLDVENMKPDSIDSNDKSTIKSKTKPNKFGDNQFFGPWFSYKTTHVIIINNTEKESVPQMYEQV